VSLLLVAMIYTSTKALKFLSVPVYTIFKNLTIIVIAYGEVLWFGGSVSPLALLSFGLMVLSSVVAAWADIQSAIDGAMGSAHETTSDALSTLNAGYAWMGLNVVATSAYVLSTRKVIKKMNFKDRDCTFVMPCNSGLDSDLLTSASSHVLQQPPDNPCPAHLLPARRRLVR
jgi:GDP-mannose transporter